MGLVIARFLVNFEMISRLRGNHRITCTRLIRFSNTKYMQVPRVLYGSETTVHKLHHDEFILRTRESNVNFIDNSKILAGNAKRALPNSTGPAVTIIQNQCQAYSFGKQGTGVLFSPDMSMFSILFSLQTLQCIAIHTIFHLGLTTRISFFLQCSIPLQLTFIIIRTYDPDYHTSFHDNSFHVIG